MADIKAFSFYKSYHSALKDLPIEDRKEMLIAIDDFVFEDEIPKLKGTNKIIWTLIEPSLTKSKNKSTNAKKSTENQNEIKSKSNQNQTSHDIFMIYSYIIYHISNNIIINNNKYNNNIINSMKEYIQLRYDNGWSIKESTIIRLIDKLNDIGKTDKQKLDIINSAIDNNWKNFYEINSKDKKEEIVYDTV